MPAQKTVTRQTFIGEGGISLISQMVNDMGHLFHPRRVDHGIDGHIDLVDPTTKVVLNSQILVQSKASDLPFPGETGDAFYYLCDQRDLDLWLGGNAPVILVLSHPKTRDAWWVDIRAAFPDARARLTRRVDVSKARDRFDASAAGALLHLGKPRSSGFYLPPTPRPERLTTNLLTIESVPPSIYLAPAVTGSYSEAGQRLRGNGGRVTDAWILGDGLVFSFANLRDEQWKPIVAGGVEEIDSSEWLDSSDRNVINRTSSLISRALQGAYPELRWHGEQRHVHFKATSDLSILKAGRGRGRRGRTVFKPRYRPDGALDYCAHAAADLRPRRIDGRWYVGIVPDWCFTRDGWQPSPRMDSLRSGIKRLERHAAVAGWLTMWESFLSADRDLLSPERPIELGSLLELDVAHGINDALWGPAPAAADEEEVSASTTDVEADLAALWDDEGDDES